MTNSVGEWVPHRGPLPVQLNAFEEYLKQYNVEPEIGRVITLAGIRWEFKVKEQDKIDD